jgi:hypothetical protein
VAYGRRRYHDELQHVKAVSRAWSRGWSASCSEEETRPEWLQATSRFGRGGLARFTAK